MRFAVSYNKLYRSNNEMKRFCILCFLNFLKIGVKLILQLPSCSLQKSALIFATSDQIVLLDVVSVDFFVSKYIFSDKDWIYKC